MPLTFEPGSDNGTERCTGVTASPDDLVECEEYFTAILALTTIGASLSIGTNVSNITILDIEGTLPYQV